MKIAFLTPAVSDEPCRGFPPEEIPPAFTEKVYDEYVRIDDDLEVAGIQTDSELCDEVTQGREDNEEADESCDAVAIIPPKNKEVLDALDTICRRLNAQGMDMDKFFANQLHCHATHSATRGAYFWQMAHTKYGKRSEASRP